MYAELRAIDSTQGLNRDLMKAEARRIIGTMRNSEIRPGKFHQNMIRAAQRAAATKDKAEKVLAKQQQMVNHYLYKEAVKAKKDINKYIKHVNDVKSRKYNTRHVHPDYVLHMKMLANLYSAKKDTTDAEIKKLVKFIKAQDEALKGVALLDPQLIAAVAAAKDETITPILMKDMTMAELRGLYLQLKNLRFVGGRESEALADLRRADSRTHQERDRQRWQAIR
jgi:GTP1/Obg family GTP-binding protein